MSNQTEPLRIAKLHSSPGLAASDNVTTTSIAKPKGLICTVDSKINRSHRGVIPRHYCETRSGARLVISFGTVSQFCGDAIVSAAPRSANHDNNNNNNNSRSGSPANTTSTATSATVECRAGEATIAMNDASPSKWKILAKGPTFPHGGMAAAYADFSVTLNQAYVEVLRLAKDENIKTMACVPLSLSAKERGVITVQHVFDVAVFTLFEGTSDDCCITEVHLVTAREEEIECARKAIVKCQQGFRPVPTKFEGPSRLQVNFQRATSTGTLARRIQKRLSVPALPSARSRSPHVPHAHSARHRKHGLHLGDDKDDDDDALSTAKLLVELQKRKRGFTFGASEARFQREAMERAVSILCAVDNVHDLTALKFLVDDIGVSCGCNMSNLVYKFLPLDSELQKRLLSHFAAIAGAAPISPHHPDNQKSLSSHSNGEWKHDHDIGVSYRQASPRPQTQTVRDQHQHHNQIQEDHGPADSVASSTSVAVPRLISGRLAELRDSFLADLGLLRKPSLPAPNDLRKRIIMSDIDDTLYQSVTGGRKWYVAEKRQPRVVRTRWSACLLFSFVGVPVLNSGSTGIDSLCFNIAILQ